MPERVVDTPPSVPLRSWYESSLPYTSTKVGSNPASPLAVTSSTYYTFRHGNGTDRQNDAQFEHTQGMRGALQEPVENRRRLLPTGCSSATKQ